jgi:hypothetical protein
MDAQDFHNIQEAYLGVYQELDELDKRTLQSYQSKAKNQVLGSMSKVSDTTVKRVKGLQLAQKRLKDKKYGQQKEQADLYDIILSHLLDEGYAETQEAAEAIMVNMSEDWREEIVEGMTMKDFKANRKKLQRKADSDDAKKRGHVDKFTGKPYGTAEAASRRKNLNPAERESRRKFAEDPD